jgi:TRAP-type C4-dicarboxylate transport system permease large subunit
MSNVDIAELAVLAVFVLVLSGVPISFSLIVTSFVGMYLITDKLDVAFNLLNAVAYSGIRDYVFAVIPLFVLMGAFMTNSRAAESLFTAVHYLLKKVRSGLAIATVGANAIFAAVTGVSVASAAVFSNVAYPQMQRYGYSKRMSLGVVAGSSILGMLIPPSLLMILYGILTQVSIGKMFIAGLVPGLVLALMFSAYLYVSSFFRPDMYGIDTPNPNRFVLRAQKKAAARKLKHPEDLDSDEFPDLVRPSGKISLPGMVTQTIAIQTVQMSFGKAMLGAVPIVALVALVIGGIWGGVFSPTEASAVGAVGALIIAPLMGMDWKKFIKAFQQTAVAVGGILLLLISASFFSRMLATSGFINQVSEFIQGLDIGPIAIVILFILILIVMGTILDSSSILLLAIPLMFPSILALGIDPIWFGIVFIIAVEIGLLTPPFGMVPFAMNATLGKRASVEDIFAGSFPFVLVMVAFLVLLMFFPGIATWLPELLR